jgi:Rrf2 family protein
LRVSNKSEHALHAMLFIAGSGEKVCPINEIAEKESIPREYLAKILKQLTEKGFLKSYKGIYGGYKLAKAPQKISFLNIMESMDGPFSIISCANDTHFNKGKKKRQFCTAQVFWIPLQDKLREALGSMTLDKAVKVK